MLRRILPILIVLVGVAGFMALKATRPQAPAVAPQERVWRVQTEAVTPAPHRPVLALFGRVEAPDRVRAAAPVAGRLLTVAVRDGERVEAGTLLARMDPRDLEPRLAQARAEVAKEELKLIHDRDALAQERALLELAETALGRADKVQSQRLGTAADVDQAREQLARARLAVTLREQAIAEHPARLAVLEAKLAEAERDAARGEIRAPFAARIGVVEAAAGDQVQPNQTILTLYPHDGLYLRAKIPGDRSEELRAALAAGERLTARARHAGRTFGATLDRLAGEADARGVDALLRLEPDADLPLGAFVDLTLERPVAANTLALPFAALNGGERIYSVVEGRLRAVPIERVGEVEEGGVGKVLVRAQGIGAAARVMVTHLPNAVDGLKVQEVREAEGLAQAGTQAGAKAGAVAGARP
jgi:RND family efflux transporter MFP subunit